MSWLFRHPHRGRAIRNELPAATLRTLYDVLEGIAGIGCSVVKPLDKDGDGWRIVVDGTSDIEAAEWKPPMPFEVVWIGGGWRCWLAKAVVVYCGLEVEMSEDLKVDEGGDYTEEAFGFGPVYLAVVSEDGTHDHDKLSWTVSGRVPSNAVWSRVLADVSRSGCSQKYRGDLIVYRFADSDPVGISERDGAAGLVESSSAAASTSADTAFVACVVSGPSVEYDDLHAFLSAAAEYAVDEVEEAYGDRDTATESEVDPSLWEGLEQAVRDCLSFLDPHPAGGVTSEPIAGQSVDVGHGWMSAADATVQTPSGASTPSQLEELYQILQQVADCVSDLDTSELDDALEARAVSLASLQAALASVGATWGEATIDPAAGTAEIADGPAPTQATHAKEDADGVRLLAATQYARFQSLWARCEALDNGGAT